MNFKEAVKVMEKGGRVTRGSTRYIGRGCYFYIENDCLKYTDNGTVIDAKWSELILSNDIDWEVLDEDKDWNLAEQPLYPTSKLTGQLKKCRDLITKDLKLNNTYAEVVKILAKRFGDLK